MPLPEGPLADFNLADLPHLLAAPNLFPQSPLPPLPTLEALTKPLLTSALASSASTQAASTVLSEKQLTTAEQALGKTNEEFLQK